MKTKIFIMGSGVALALLVGAEITSAAMVVCGPNGCPPVLQPTYPGSPFPPPRGFPPPDTAFVPPLVNTFNLIELIENSVGDPPMEPPFNSVEVGCIQPPPGETNCLQTVGNVVDGDVVLVEAGATNVFDPHQWSDVLRFRSGTVQLISDDGSEIREFSTIGGLNLSDLSDNAVFLPELAEPTVYLAGFIPLERPDIVFFGTQYLIFSDLDFMLITIAPEPPAITVFGIGILMLLVYRRAVSGRDG